MMKKRMYLLIATMVLLGTTACGNGADTTEMTTTQEHTEVATQEIPAVEETTEEVTTDDAAEEATTEETTEETTAEVTTQTAQTDGTITVEEAEQLIITALGTEDSETGNKYGFIHSNTMTVDSVEYHVFTWNWYVDGTMSHLTDLFVATDGSAIYEGMFAGDDATVYTEMNYLNK